MVAVERLKTFTATSAVEASRLVKLSAASGTHVEHNGAGETAFVGVTQHAAAAGQAVSVALRGPWCTVYATAAEAFSAGATLYAAAAGKVKDSVDGAAVGTALQAATADGQIVECLFDAGSGATGVDPDQLAIDDGTLGAVPMHLMVLATATGATAIPKPARKIRIVDAWCQNRGTTDTNVNLVNASSTATRANVAAGTTADVFKQLEITDAQYTVLATSTLYAHISTAEATGVEVHVLAVPVA